VSIHHELRRLAVDPGPGELEEENGDANLVAIAAFRYALIRPALDPSLTARQRGMIVRRLAEKEHVDPCGDRVRFSRPTLDRWIRAWRRDGFEGLIPDRHRTPGTVLQVADALRDALPDICAPQIAEALRRLYGWAPSERTLQRHLAALVDGDHRPPR